MKNPVFRVLLLLLIFAAAISHAQVITKAEYFVDVDPGVGLATPLTLLPGDTVIRDFSYSTAGLAAGFHKIYVRTCDEAGRWGIAMPTLFYIYGTEPDPASLPRYFPIVRAEYFFDSDPGVGLGTPLPLIRNESVSVDRYLLVNGLDTGYHYLYIRAMDERNIWGNASRSRFHVDTAICAYPVANFTWDTVTYGTPCHLTNLTPHITGTIYQWEITDSPAAQYFTQNVIHTFSVPGYYTAKLTVTRSPGCDASIIQDVMTGPVPDTNILIAGSTTLCDGDSVILTSNNYEEGTTYDWNTGDTSRAIIVKTTGDYYCWAKNSYGIFIRSEIVQVTVHEVPQVTVKTFDATGGLANGSAWVEVTGGPSTVGITWNDGYGGFIRNDLASGNYAVTVTDGHCPVVTLFSIGSGPVLPGNILAAEYFYDTDPGEGNATPINIWAGDTVDYKFTTPTGGLSIGFHYLYIRTKDTWNRWSIATRSMISVYDPYPTPVGKDQPLLTEAEYFINTDPGIGNGIDIPVTGGEMIDGWFYIPTYDLNPGFYNLFIRAKDAGGKWSIYRPTLFYIYEDQHVDLAKRQKSLAGVEYFYDTDPGWRNGVTYKTDIHDDLDLTRDFRIGNLSAGNYYMYLRAYDERRIMSEWQRVSFNVLPVSCTCPLVDFSVDTVKLLGNASHFVNKSTLVDPGATYEWDVNGDGVIDYTTDDCNHIYPAYGLYTARLTVKNSPECYASMTKVAVVSPPIDTALLVTGPVTFCDGDSLVIQAAAGYTYAWSNDQTTQSIVVKTSGDYSVRLENIYGLQGFSRTIRVTVYPLPVISLTAIEASGGNANGTAICYASGGTGSYNYLWSTGSTLSIVNDLLPGTYYVTVSDGRCPVVDSCIIGNHPVFPGDILAAEYFFDTDPGVGNAIPINIAGGDSVYYATCMPMTGLEPGYHYLYIRAMDTYNRWGNHISFRFYVNSPLPDVGKDQPPIVRGEYFFDTDPGVGNGTTIPLPTADEITHDFEIPVTGLTDGFHDLYIRVIDSVGQWSLDRRVRMYQWFDPGVVPPFNAPKIVAAEYFFDADPGVGNGLPIPFTPTGDEIDLNRWLPVGALSPGTHVAYIRVKDESGAWSIGKGSWFMVNSTLCQTPTVDFTYGNAMPGAPVAFTNTSVNLIPGTTYQWDIGNDGTIDYLTKDIVHTFASSGNYDVRLTVANSDTCQASILKQVVVGPIPSNSITVTGNVSFCDGDSVRLEATAGYTYTWWPTGETTSFIYAKNSGHYYCWIKTAAGVEVKSQVIAVIRHQIPTVTLHVIDASGGNSNGSAWVDVAGGTGNYAYSWSSGATTIYANNLAPGNYTVQVNDGYCPVTNSFTIATHPVYPGNIVAAEYFFDTDPGVGNAIPMNIAAGDTAEYFTGCNVTGLVPGYHQLFVRTKDTDQRWSIYAWQKFYVYEQPEPIVAHQPPLISGEYFVDLDPVNRPDPGVGLGTLFTFVAGDNVAGDFGYLVDTLVVGFHHIAARVKDQKGQWSHNLPTLFYIYDTTYSDQRKIQPNLIAAEYYLDSDPGVGHGVPVPIIPGESVIGDFNLFLGTTGLGDHFLYVRVMDEDQKWSLYARAAFTVVNCTQPTVNFSFIQTCITTPVTFNDLSVNVDPAAVYEWDFNNDGIVDDHTHGTVSHLYTIPGIYQCKLKITHNTACRDSILHTVIFPFVHLPNDTTIYTDQSMVLDAGAGYTYAWSTGENTQTITVNGATAGLGLHTYSVTVTNFDFCDAADTINVTITLPPRDLIVESAAIVPNTIPANGDSADLQSLIRNTGTISAVASVVNYYLSSDNQLSMDDQLLGFEIVNSLAAGAAHMVTGRILIPPGVNGQSWYIIFEADGSGLVIESNEDNNLLAVNFSYGPIYIPQNLSVLNQNIPNSQTRCYNALQVLTVAGSGSYYYVQSGGSATFIAGQKIRFLPGVKVFAGGYLHGYIAASGPWCFAAPVNKLMTVNDSSNHNPGLPQASDGECCFIYPNPTPGEFMLSANPGDTKFPLKAQIYNAMGVLIKERMLESSHTHRFSLADQPPGIYFLVLRSGDWYEMLKVIRR